MWLRDFLPMDIEDARIITYGYDSRLDGPHPTQHRLLNFQRTFLEEFDNLRFPDQAAKVRRWSDGPEQDSSNFNPGASAGIHWA